MCVRLGARATGALAVLLSDAYALDLPNGTWRALPAGAGAAGGARAFHGLAAAGGRLYMQGGYGGPGAPRARRGCACVHARPRAGGVGHGATDTARLSAVVRVTRSVRTGGGRPLGQGRCDACAPSAFCILLTRDRRDGRGEIERYTRLVDTVSVRP